MELKSPVPEFSPNSRKANLSLNESRTYGWHTAFSQILDFLLFQMETNISPSPPSPPSPL